MKPVESKIKIIFLRFSEYGRGKQNPHFLHWIFPSRFLHFQTRGIWEQISPVNCADTGAPQRVRVLSLAEEGMRHQGDGDQNSLWWYCCQRVCFVEVCLHRFAEAVPLALLASLDSLPYCFNLRLGVDIAHEKKDLALIWPSTGYAKQKVPWSKSSDWHCEVDLCRLCGYHVVCVPPSLPPYLVQGWNKPWCPRG